MENIKENELQKNKDLVEDTIENLIGKKHKKKKRF